MNSIRWIQKVLIDGKPATLEIMIGVNSIADRCYVRVNQEPEYWFPSTAGNRQEIIQQGLEVLKKQLATHQVANLDGSPYSWNAP
jgi:hypothetical protein